jgi:hypothetical protein
LISSFSKWPPTNPLAPVSNICAMSNPMGLS